jgi:ketosteroid isomerase-like protein
MRNLDIAGIIAVLLVTAPPANAQAAATPPSVPLPAAVARVLTDYEKAWSSRDAAELARLFTDDGFVLPNGAPAVRGRAALEKHYAGSGGPLSLRAFAYATHGDVGYILGGYTSKKGDPDIGKFTLALRRDPRGRWLIVSDMDNGNSRPRQSN